MFMSVYELYVSAMQEQSGNVLLLVTNSKFTSKVNKALLVLQPQPSNHNSLLFSKLI